MSQASVVIVGGGIAGLASACFLGRLGGFGRGEIVLLEREERFGVHSSGRNAAILRSVGPGGASVALTQRGADFLREPPPGFADGPLLDRLGLVLAASGERADELDGWVEAAGRATRALRLTPAELRRVAPHLAGRFDSAWSFPEEGRIDIARLVDAFARAARASGVELRTAAAAVALLLEGERVAGVRLADGTVVRARTTVIAAGGWAGRLGAGAGSRLRLRPTRRHLLVTAPGPDVDPAWPVLWCLDGEGFYCRPESGGMLLCACDEVAVDPDRCVPDPTALERIAEGTGRLLPDLSESGAAHFWCGLRTFTDDRRFAVGWDPDVAGLFWVAGLGGSGMGSGAAVGRLAAELVVGTAPRDPLAETVAPERLLPAAS